MILLLEADKTVEQLILLSLLVGLLLLMTVLHTQQPGQYRSSCLYSHILTALALLMPPPYPGITCSLAMYVRLIAAPPGFMMGPNRCIMLTKL